MKRSQYPRSGQASSQIMVLTAVFSRVNRRPEEDQELRLCSANWTVCATQAAVSSRAQSTHYKWKKP
jgi:hypothetical protein